MRTLADAFLAALTWRTGVVACAAVEGVRAQGDAAASALVGGVFGATGLAGAAHAVLAVFARIAALATVEGIGVCDDAALVAERLTAGTDALALCAELAVIVQARIATRAAVTGIALGVGATAEAVGAGACGTLQDTPAVGAD